MKVVVVGGGGREQAIAWACRRHGHDVELVGHVNDLAELTPDLVIPGPEAALVAGVADQCAERGIACFGPTAALAQLEAARNRKSEVPQGMTTIGSLVGMFGGVR